MQRRRSWTVAIGPIIVIIAGCGPGTATEDGGSGPLSSTGPGPIGSTGSAVTATSSTSSATEPVGTSASSTGALDSTTDDPGSSSGGLPDLGPLSCDLFAQDCPVGHKCTPWASDGGPFQDATRCVPVVPGPGQPGEPCSVEGSPASGLDDCDLGLVCFELDPDTSVGVCRELCEPDGPGLRCGDPDTACVSWYDGGLPVCSPACDPLLQDCPSGLTCYGMPQDIVCDSASCGYSLPRGAGQQGDPCTWPNQCDPGLQCTEGTLVPGCAGARCCTAICDVTEPAACDAVPGTSCMMVDDEGQCPPQIYYAGVCATP